MPGNHNARLGDWQQIAVETFGRFNTIDRLNPRVEFARIDHVARTAFMHYQFRVR